MTDRMAQGELWRKACVGRGAAELFEANLMALSIPVCSASECALAPLVGLALPKPHTQM